MNRTHCPKPIGSDGRLSLTQQSLNYHGAGMDTEIRQLEEALRIAMLTSDVAALDGLIADALIFVGHSGEVFGKQDDLALHRSGRQKLSVAEWQSVEIALHDQNEGVSQLSGVVPNSVGTPGRSIAH